MLLFGLLDVNLMLFRSLVVAHVSCNRKPLAHQQQHHKAKQHNRLVCCRFSTSRAPPEHERLFAPRIWMEISGRIVAVLLFVFTATAAYFGLPVAAGRDGSANKQVPCEPSINVNLTGQCPLWKTSSRSIVYFGKVLDFFSAVRSSKRGLGDGNHYGCTHRSLFLRQVTCECRGCRSTPPHRSWPDDPQAHHGPLTNMTQQQLQLIVVPPAGIDSFTVVASPDTTIGQIMRDIAKQTRIPVGQQLLLHNGGTLPKTSTVRDLHLTDGAHLDLTPTMVGGMCCCECGCTVL
jgi:hypothetical protein